MLGVGLVAIVAFALQYPMATAVSIFSIAALVGLASLVAGGLLGFLFGVPRALQSANPNNGTSTGYRANTNLEQISDWLTKILVGVTLTQLQQIPSQVERLVMFLSPGLGGDSRSQVFALGLVTYFSIIGFLVGYLLTRLLLGQAFYQADLADVGQQLSAIAKTSTASANAVQQQQKQDVTDAQALSLVDQQLNATAPTVPQDQLNAAVAAGSSMAQLQIFQRAQDQRTRYRDTDKAKMERTIPVFMALVAADPDRKNHGYRGQLGFALKDKQQPGWEGALQQLADAITIRGAWQDNGWLLYEFNRAICRIELDSGFTTNTPSTLDAAGAIRSDLKAAATDSYVKQIIDGDATIAAWLRLNHLTLDEALS